MIAPRTWPVIRIANPRPLVIAIGPTAATQVESSRMVLEPLDVGILDSGRSGIDAARLADLDRELGHRPSIVCLMDGRDEGWWSAAAHLARVAQRRSATPLVFVCSDPRARRPERGAMLGRLARQFGACVIDAPNEPEGLVRACVVPLVGWFGPGLIGVAPADLDTVMRPPAVGWVAFAAGLPSLASERWSNIRTWLSEARISRVLVTIRCDGETRLEEINVVARFITDLVPEASVLFAATMRSIGTPGGLEVDLLALHGA